ncbi:MauE/DoxX family redox-associated membrane protein [uncultured Algibacter sp.]|uniref:heavy metal translocating P-type ATPase n=1 Tax=uncultured Algibacter sp. TaxID=298659 RepID=UPI002602979E|nr:MauE/DoxX family redox-associated membrane protein [uncultured Algibacter sp.]
MKHTYTVTGMTCNGCRTSVEKALNQMSGVISASVSLEKSEAVIEMLTHISNKNLQSVLSDKYIISEKNIFQDQVSHNVEHKSQLRQLFPLFLIFGYIISASILINYENWNTSSFMFDFMGMFYIVFSFFKLLDLKGFPDSFRMYDPLAQVVPIYAWVYPFIEVVLGLMFLMRFKVSIALVITLFILGITTVGVVKSLLGKKTIPCACLGTALKLPMTKATFIENTVMILMAIIMLIKTFG